MKCIVVFLVLSVVILMTEPADGSDGGQRKFIVPGTLESFGLLLALIGKNMAHVTAKSGSQSNAAAAATVSLL